MMKVRAALPTSRTTPSSLASFVANPPRPTAQTIDRAKKVIADTFAVNLAGTSSEVLEPLLRYAESAAGKGGQFPVLGTASATTAEYAALINGSLSAALEFDDVLSMMPGHPSAVVVPALNVTEAALRGSGTDFIRSYMVGIEAGARLAQVLTLDHYKRGFHTTGVVAIFSAVAAIAHARRDSPQLVDRALGIAASMASGIQGNFGTMTKPLHSGWASRSAVCAVSLASQGLSGSENIFETQGGFFDAYGADTSSLDDLDARLANPWVFDHPGVTMKLFPCCYATHRGIDAILTIKEQLKLNPETVRHVTCKVPPGALVPLKFRVPKDRSESLFSLPYALCVAMLHDRPRLASFGEEQVHSPEVAKFLERIEVFEDPSCVARYPNYQEMSYGSRGEVTVIVETTDGRSQSATVAIAPGHPDRAMTWEQVYAKLQDCAGAAGFDLARASLMYERLQALEGEQSMRSVLELFQKR